MRCLLAAACFAIGLAVPASALAAGGPVPPVQGGAGVTLPGGPVRYVALGVGHDTLVERVRTRGGAVERTRLLPGSWGVAGAAYDGSNTGLSGDGRTLVLADVNSGNPPRSTRLVVLDTRRLRPGAPISIPGFHAVDAISPDGRWLYLIHYADPNDPLSYEVRTFDLREGRLLARPIVDPHEPDEKMAGIPMTRTSSPGGRWAYTLYQRPEGEPFIHALDTARRTARCIDLPALAGGDFSGVRLVLGDGGGTLTVTSPAGPQAVVDTATFEVGEPAASSPRPAPAPARQAAPDRGGDSPWVLALVPLAALVALVLARRRRRMRSLPA